MESQEPPGPSRPYENGAARSEALNISVRSPLRPFGHEKRLGQKDIDLGVINDAVLRRFAVTTAGAPE